MWLIDIMNSVVLIQVVHTGMRSFEKNDSSKLEDVECRVSLFLFTLFAV
jgi:hypothetical protein